MSENNSITICSITYLTKGKMLQSKESGVDIKYGINIG